MKSNFLLISCLLSFQCLFSQTNPLADGQIIKIPVSNSGIYKLDFDYLKNKAGLNIENINPKLLSIWGNEGGMMNGLIDSDYDAHENSFSEVPIFVSGETDGSFGSNDFVLFYAEGASTITADLNAKKLSQPTNRFDNNNYYFLKIGNSEGKRIQTVNSVATFQYVSESFDDVLRYEKEQRNLLAEWVEAQGSGQFWYGEWFKNTRSYTIDNYFNFPNLITSEPIEVDVHMEARVKNISTRFNVEINDQIEQSSNFASVNSGSSTTDYCKPASLKSKFIVDSEAFPVTVEYPRTSVESEGWLDYIEINAKRALKMAGTQMIFRDFETIDYSEVSYRIANSNDNIEVWEITSPFDTRKREGVQENGFFQFNDDNNNQLNTFIAFNKNGDFLNPGEPQEVPNQNLHNISNVDMAIIYHPDFKESAELLAEHRMEHDGYSIITVPIEAVFNEFSSGSVDPVGIRNFSKMLYDRNPEKFKYLLLFGDGSFDYRNIYGKGKNFIPVYETLESHNPVNAYPADDYFGLLTIGEGTNLAGDLEVSVGRIPVETPEEAQAVVNKLIRYDTDENTMKDWRNRITFVSDDDDDDAAGTHIDPSEQHARTLDNFYPNFNVDKIYLDAFPQIATSGGQKIPSVNEAIDKTLFKGVLAINYFGHGGSKGWAQERVLKIENIFNWQNLDRLPLFITATCSFAGYDDPNFKTAGEEVFLNPKGGAFAMLSTTRAVYISGNEILVKAVFDEIFKKHDGKYHSIGEMFKDAKNAALSSAGYQNTRKFTLIGDPSMFLAIPKKKVNTTFINGHDVLDGFPDTLRALQEVTIEGEILDENDQIMTNFNGSVYPTIFDKKTTLETLGHESGSPPRAFELQKNVLFKGKASVENGRFKFTFVMPKDINYEFGFGKISYYAENGVNLDASGNYRNIIIGGTDPKVENDDQGPVVEVFMNNEDFEFGGITSNHPVLFVKLSDDNGINVAGTSIGHDLNAILDNESQNPYILNDFYESELNDYKKGVVKFPLSNLAEGRHRIEVTAWDVANNFGEGFTEFIVANSEEVALMNVLNFPNPFTDKTCIGFDHNLAGESMIVQIDIYAMSGQLVKTIEQELTPSGFRIRQSECIEWDGRNDQGGRLARGVYVYNVKIKSTEINSLQFRGESEFRKMVLLK